MAKDLDNKLDFDNDDLGLDDDLLSMDNFDPFATPPPAKNKREAVLNTLKSGTKSFVDDIKDDKLETATTIAKNALPKSLSGEQDEVVHVAKDVKDELVKAATEIRTKANTTLNSFERLLPKNEKVTAVTNKIRKWMGVDDDSNEDRKKSESELQAAKIAEAIGDTLGEKTQREKVEELISKKIELNRFKTSTELANTAAVNLESIRAFNNEITANYYRRSLELKYKSLFIAQKQLDLLATAMDGFKNQFNAIVTNTGLPDMVKIHKNEALKHDLKSKAYGGITETLYNGNNIFGNTRRNLVNGISNIKNQALAGMGLIDDTAESKETFGETAAMAGGTGGILGMLLGSKIKEFLGSTIGDRLAENKNIKKNIYKTKNAFMDIGGNIDKIKSKEREYTTDKDGNRKETLKSRLMHGAASIASNFTGSRDDKENTLTINKEKLTDSTIFDNRTKSSINKVIPQLLSKIYGEVKSIRTKDGKPESNELIYDYRRDKFTTSSQIEKNIRSDIHNKISKDTTYYVDAFMDDLTKYGGLKLTSEIEVKQLRRGVTKYLLSGGSLAPTSLTSKKFLNNFTKEMKKKVLASVVKMLKKAKEDVNILSRTNSNLKHAKESLPTLGDLPQELIDSGNAKELAAMRLLKTNKETGELSFNNEQYKEMLLDEMGKVSAKDANKYKEEVNKKDAEKNAEKSFAEKAKESLKKKKDKFKKDSAAKAKAAADKLKKTVSKLKTEEDRNKLKDDTIAKAEEAADKLKKTVSKLKTEEGRNKLKDDTIAKAEKTIDELKKTTVATKAEKTIDELKKTTVATKAKKVRKLGKRLQQHPIAKNGKIILNKMRHKPNLPNISSYEFNETEHKDAVHVSDIPKFKQGGYTGNPETKDDIVGLVHGDETVINSKKLDKVSGLFNKLMGKHKVPKRPELIDTLINNAEHFIDKERTTEDSMYNKTKTFTTKKFNNISAAASKIDLNSFSVRDKIYLSQAVIKNSDMVFSTKKRIMSILDEMKDYNEQLSVKHKSAINEVLHYVEIKEYTKALKAYAILAKDIHLDMAKDGYDKVKDNLNPLDAANKTKEKLLDITSKYLHVDLREYKKLKEEFYNSEAYKKGIVKNISEYAEGLGLHIPKKLIKDDILDNKTSIKTGKFAKIKSLVTGIHRTDLDREAASLLKKGITGLFHTLNPLYKKEQKIKEENELFDQNKDGTRDGNWKVRLKNWNKSKKSETKKTSNDTTKDSGSKESTLKEGLVGAGGVILGGAAGLLSKLSPFHKKETQAQKDAKIFDTDKDGRRDGNWRDELKSWNKHTKGAAKESLHKLGKGFTSKGIPGLVLAAMGIAVAGLKKLLWGGLKHIPGLLKNIGKNILKLPFKLGGLLKKFMPGLLGGVVKAVKGVGSTVIGAGVGAVKLAGKGISAVGKYASKTLLGTERAEKIGKTFSKVGEEALKVGEKISKSGVASKIIDILRSFKTKILEKLGEKAGAELVGELSAKIAARLVPFVGWSLLLWDAGWIIKYMVVDKLSLKSAVSKQILGFDLFSKDSAPVNAEGQPIKPIIKVKYPKKNDKNKTHIGVKHTATDKLTPANNNIPSTVKHISIKPGLGDKTSRSKLIPANNNTNNSVLNTVKSNHAIGSTVGYKLGSNIFNNPSDYKSAYSQFAKKQNTTKATNHIIKSDNALSTDRDLPNDKIAKINSNNAAIVGVVTSQPKKRIVPTKHYQPVPQDINKPLNDLHMVSQDSNKLLANMDNNIGYTVNIQLKILELLTKMESDKKNNTNAVSDVISSVFDTTPKQQIEHRRTEFPKPTIDISKHTNFAS